MYASSEKPTKVPFFSSSLERFIVFAFVSIRSSIKALKAFLLYWSSKQQHLKSVCLWGSKDCLCVESCGTENRKQKTKKRWKFFQLISCNNWLKTYCFDRFSRQHMIEEAKPANLFQFFCIVFLFCFFFEEDTLKANTSCCCCYCCSLIWEINHQIWWRWSLSIELFSTMKRVSIFSSSCFTWECSDGNLIRGSRSLVGTHPCVLFKHGACDVFLHGKKNLKF